MPMSAEEWYPLIHGPDTLGRRIRASLRKLGLLRVTLRSAGIALGARNALGLERWLPITPHDRVTRQLGAIVDRSPNFFKDVARAPTKGTMVFPHFRGSPFLELFEIFLAYRLWLEGYQPLFLACGVLSICNNYDLGADARRNPEVCRRCVRNQGQLLRASRLPFETLATSPAAIDEAMRRTGALSVEECHRFVYREVPVGELVVPSVGRHLRRTALLASDPEEVDAWRAYVASACVLVDRLTEVLDRVHPRRGLIPGGWFMWYAVAYHLMRQRSIPTAFYEVSFHDAPRGHRWVLSQGFPLTDPSWISAAWDEWRSVPLTPDEKTHLDRELSARRHGSIYNPSPVESVAEVRRSLNIPDDGRPLVALFTGLTWDYAIYGKGPSAFTDMADWVAETLRFMAEKNAWVVVRIHPAEAILHEGVYSREHMEELLRQRLGELPANARIVPAASKVSSYTLVDLADVAVFFASTLGLETAVRGRIPLILASYSVLSGRGFGHQPTSLEGYRQLLSEPRSLTRPRPDEIEAARRFTYLYFFRNAWPLQFYDSGANGIYSIDRFRIRTLDELRPGNNRWLDRLVAGIQGGGPLAMPRDLPAPSGA
jgi:hypothetical protein